MLVIPDIHGRSFWKNAVANALPGEKIIFLGDYLDPYYDETDPFTHTLLTPAGAFENFKEILAFKKDHAEDVVLLLGNHDTEYCFGTKACREDEERWDMIRSLFLDNIHLFGFGYYATVKGVTYTFSHAAILEGWARKNAEILGECKSPTEVIDRVNALAAAELCEILDQYGWYRGGIYKYGSMVWADVRECNDLGWHQDDVYQVFGHTQSEEEMIDVEYAMLDCHHAFRIDEQLEESFIGNRLVKI